MKSLTGNSPSARGWALLLILFLGAGLFVAACGEEETPAPTTPPPAPPPTPTPPPPEPEPEAPAVPTGLHVDERTANSITWHWNAVEGAVGYVVQAGMDETWDASDTVTFNGAPFTTETHYTATGLEPETTVYVRVAAAAGTVENHAVSDFSTHVTGMTMADTPPGPPTPANLRVTGQTSNSITWEWNAVEGATGYQSQFSGTSTFPTGSTGREFSTNTTRTVSNLDAEADGYLRVRAYTGTQAEPVFGMWTEGQMGTTEEPPPAAPLSAPDGLANDGRSDTTITLTWDGVRNAGSYEVEQRVTGGDWGDANCGADGNEVEDEECVASGLAAGTDYDFRVRAVPSDTDRYETSAWSDTWEDRTSGTAPRPTTPATPGGMGGLNVTWKADSTITWSWEPVAGAEYEWKVVTTGLDFDAADPCGVDGYDGSGTEFSETSAGPVALLCVRTKDPKDDKKDLSWAFATIAAASPPTVGDPTPAADAGERTRALTWGGIAVPANFSYDINIVAEGGGVKAAPTGDDLQEACAAGIQHETDDSDVALTGLSTTFRSNPQPYTGYLLCLRYANQTGKTDWVAASRQKLHGPRTAPPRPAKDGTLSADDPEADKRDHRLECPYPRERPVFPGSRPDYNFKVIDAPVPARRGHLGHGRFAR